MAQPQEVIARARALQGLVRAEAPRTESQRNLTAPVVQALLDAELFYLMVPAALVLHFRNEKQVNFLFPRLFTECQL